MEVTTARVLYLIFALTVCIDLRPALASAGGKCSKPACDLKAIGHRRLFKAKENWFSPKKEEEMGEKLSAALEQMVELLKDDSVTTYLDNVAQHIVANSDADMPVTVRIIRGGGVNAFTLPGGHLYVTSELLLQLQTESDLATILARGIAHVALHSAAREQTRSSLLEMASVPLVFVGHDADSVSASGVRSFGLLKFQREFELEADYFGIQYMYKAGYDPGCFLKAIERLGQPDSNKPQLSALSPFPPLTDRMKALQKEIEDILPSQPGAIVSTPEFDQFIVHLRQLVPPKLRLEKDPKPELVRHE